MMLLLLILTLRKVVVLPVLPDFACVPTYGNGSHLFTCTCRLTLKAVISSSASAVVSSNSVFACCSWLSKARRAACRLLICDSRSCRERVNSDTCLLISSFSSSCSKPIWKGNRTVVNVCLLRCHNDLKRNILAYNYHHLLVQSTRW